jgi:four helix bundle protein
MATLTKFEEIEAWRKSRALVNAVYECSRAGPFARDFGLRDQMRRAAVSVMSNIAEGFERGGTAEFIQFLTMAKGSASEVHSQLYTALDQEYLNREQFERIADLAIETKRLIGGFIGYLKRSGIRGNRFKQTDTMR